MSRENQHHIIKLSIQYAIQRTAAAGSLNCRDSVRLLHCQKKLVANLAFICQHTNMCEYPYCAMVKVFARPVGRAACLRFCVFLLSPIGFGHVIALIQSPSRLSEEKLMEIETEEASPMS